MQVIFNDPVLYALRIAVDKQAPAGKIFAGLDFQILYRQISDTVGVYQSAITLPEAMRRFTSGAFTITLPSFEIQVYTNGNFQVDIGFPWDMDFSRSFTIEGIVPPGIPVMGSGGLYFGKLSSETTNQVPATTDGTFNPVYVFGYGQQMGLGKSFKAGILKADFSITVVGVIQGVIAKWNPYDSTQTGGSSSKQLQGQYYFWLKGTVGLLGRLNGTIDFSVVKAYVNVNISLSITLVYEAYADIAISAIANVSIAVTIKINAGLFKIKIHMSFSAKIKKTFVIQNPGGTDAPWQVEDQSSRVQGLLAKPQYARLSWRQRSALAESTTFVPYWANLEAPATKAPLTGYLATGLAMTWDEWNDNPDDTPAASYHTPAEQIACYVLSLFIDSVAAPTEDTESSALKAAGEADDTPFETLCKQVFRWLVAAGQPQGSLLTAAQVDQLTLSETALEDMLDYLSDADNPQPIPLDVITAFLGAQFDFTVSAPDTGTDTEVDVTYFPMVPELLLTVPAYGTNGNYPGYSYRFSDYNSLSAGYAEQLSAYFAELQVAMPSGNDGGGPTAGGKLANADLSLASYMFADLLRAAGPADGPGCAGWLARLQAAHRCHPDDRRGGRLGEHHRRASGGFHLHPVRPVRRQPGSCPELRQNLDHRRRRVSGSDRRYLRQHYRPECRRCLRCE